MPGFGALVACSVVPPKMIRHMAHRPSGSPLAGDERGLGDESEAGAGDGGTERGEHGPVVHGCGVGIEAFRSPMDAV